MSSDALNIDEALVSRLIADQFSEWSGLSVREVVPNGWDNRTFRLGEEMSVRLPSAERYVAQVQKEKQWLPFLARELPLPIPEIIAVGEPAAGYPWEWSVRRWIDGETAAPERIGNMPEFAADLAEFLVKLQSLPVDDAPVAGAHNFYRGGDLSVYDEQTREAIAVLEGRGDPNVKRYRDVWDAALYSKWERPPVWIHGDVSQGNLLVRDGRLSAVIDFGGMAIGDPACDLAIAWTMFDDDSRNAYRSGLELGEATWARGRGWTLWKVLIIVSGISETNAAEADRSREILERVLADYSRSK